MWRLSNQRGRKDEKIIWASNNWQNAINRAEEAQNRNLQDAKDNMLCAEKNRTIYDKCDRWKKTNLCQFVKKQDQQGCGRHLAELRKLKYDWDENV